MRKILSIGVFLLASIVFQPVKSIAQINQSKMANNESIVSVRYIVNNVDSCVKFYTELLDFKVVMHPAPGFAMLSKGNLHLLLNRPGAGGAGQSMPDGAVPAPGGWNRFQLEFRNLEEAIKDLKKKNAKFRNDLVVGNGGKQILLEDPSGNLVELFESNQR